MRLPLLPLLLFMATSALGQEQPCKVYFKIELSDSHIPGGSIPRMSPQQERWFNGKGQKKYPGVCLNAGKAEYLLVWSTESRSRLVSRPVTTTGDSPVSGTVVDNQTGETSTISGTTTTTTTSYRLDEERELTAFLYVVRIRGDGTIEPTPIYFSQHGQSPHAKTLFLIPGSATQRVLEDGIKYLSGPKTK